MRKILICYFSASGITERIAKNIANILDGDLFHIEPIEDYTEEDLNWRNDNSRTSIEMKDISSRPKIKNKIDNINQYDKVIIGFPVWWYTAPRIINSFIEENDLTDKDVYTFVTSGGSSHAGSLKDLKDKYTSINFISGKTLNGNISSSEIIDWIK